MKIVLKSEQSGWKVIKRDTRQWTSGRVNFAVIGLPKHPEKNYIIFEKDFFGRSKQLPQRFILHNHDWQNLKKLIEGDFVKEIRWISPQVITKVALEKIIAENPDFIETILKAPNITKFSQVSLEALDRLAIRIFEIKRENIDLIFKRLGESKDQELITFSSLLKDLKLNQVSTLSSLVYQKLKIIDLLENLTCNKEINENKIHELFENNIWLSGKNFEIVQSDRSLSKYLNEKISEEPETRRRPDLIVKKIPYIEEIILIELKAPRIKLEAKHIGQVLGYKAIIEQNKPSVKEIHCFLYGYEKSPTFTKSKDVVIKTFSEIIAELREEYAEYSRVLEVGKEVDEIS